MRVMQIHNYYKQYGGECHVVDAERELLQEYGYDVVRYTRHSADIDHASTAAKVVALLSIPFNLQEYARVRRFVNYYKPDVAHVHNIFPLISPSVYAALSSMSVPIVQTVHNYRFLCPNGLFFIGGDICEACQSSGYFQSVKKRCMHDSYIISALYSLAVSRLWKPGNGLSKVNRFIVLNSFVYNKLAGAGIDKDKLVVCSNYCDDQCGTINEKKRYILFLGRLSAEKGILTLLKSVASLDGIKLVIAGAGPEEDGCRRFVSNNNLSSVVEFAGFVEGDEKARLIAEAVCTVFPSEWYENCPVSVLESLSHGTPVIASSIGGLPDMIVDGETGLLFPPSDHVALARCVSQLWRNKELAHRLAVNALSMAKTRYTGSVHIRELGAIYQDAISNT